MPTTITPAGHNPRAELLARVEKLTGEEAIYALAWLAMGGPLSRDGQAVTHALDEVDARRALIASTQTVTTGGQL